MSSTQGNYEKVATAELLVPDVEAKAQTCVQVTAPTDLQEGHVLNVVVNGKSTSVAVVRTLQRLY